MRKSYLYLMTGALLLQATLPSIAAAQETSSTAETTTTAATAVTETSESATEETEESTESSETATTEATTATTDKSEDSKKTDGKAQEVSSHLEAVELTADGNTVKDKINSNTKILAGTLTIKDAPSADWYFKSGDEENTLKAEDLNLGGAFSHGSIASVEVDPEEPAKIHFELKTHDKDDATPQLDFLSKGMIKIPAANNRYEKDLGIEVELNDITANVKGDIKLSETDKKAATYQMTVAFGEKTPQTVKAEDLEFDGAFADAKIKSGPKMNKDGTAFTLELTKPAINEGASNAGHIIIKEDTLKYPDGTKLDEPEMIHLIDTQEPKAAADSDPEDSKSDNSATAPAVPGTSSNQDETDAKEEDQKSADANDPNIVISEIPPADNSADLDIIKTLVDTVGKVSGIDFMGITDIVFSIANFISDKTKPDPYKVIAEELGKIAEILQKVQAQIDKGVTRIISELEKDKLETGLNEYLEFANQMEKKHGAINKSRLEELKAYHEDKLTDEEKEAMANHLKGIYTTDGMDVTGQGGNYDYLNDFMDYAGKLHGLDTITGGDVFQTYKAYQAYINNWNSQTFAFRENYNNNVAYTFAKFYAPLITAMQYDYEACDAQIKSYEPKISEIEEVLTENAGKEVYASDGQEKLSETLNEYDEKLDILKQRREKTAYYLGLETPSRVNGSKDSDVSNIQRLRELMDGNVQKRTGYLGHKAELDAEKADAKNGLITSYRLGLNFKPELGQAQGRDFVDAEYYKWVKTYKGVAPATKEPIYVNVKKYTSEKEALSQGTGYVDNIELSEKRFKDEPTQNEYAILLAAIAERPKIPVLVTEKNKEGVDTPIIETETDRTLKEELAAAKFIKDGKSPKALPDNVQGLRYQVKTDYKGGFLRWHVYNGTVQYLPLSLNATELKKGQDINTSDQLVYQVSSMTARYPRTIFETKKQFIYLTYKY